MSEAPATSQPKQSPARPDMPEVAAKSALTDFAKLVQGMSRFIFELARIPPFTDFGLGLAEWAALSILAEHEEMTTKQLAKVLGLTSQRAIQLKNALKESGLIAQIGPPANWSKDSIKITSRGRARLNKMNAMLEPLLNSALTDGVRSLSSTNKEVERLMRIVNASRKMERKDPPKTAD